MAAQSGSSIAILAALGIGAYWLYSNRAGAVNPTSTVSTAPATSNAATVAPGPSAPATVPAPVQATRPGPIYTTEPVSPGPVSRPAPDYTEGPYTPEMPAAMYSPAQPANNDYTAAPQQGQLIPGAGYVIKQASGSYLSSEPPATYQPYGGGASGGAGMPETARYNSY